MANLSARPSTAGGGPLDEDQQKRSAEARPEVATGFPSLGPTLAVVGAAALIYWAIIFFGPVGEGDLSFADAYMRLVRVEELLQTGNWFDGTIERGNAPYGESLHWTRPFDLVVIGLFALLRPFLEFREALFWAGALVAPGLLIVTCVLSAWAFAPLLGRHRAWVMPLLIVQWPVLGIGFPGRADHHVLILLLFVLSMGLLLRILAAPERQRWSWLGGAIHGLGLWVGVEFLLVLTFSFAVLGLCWALTRDRDLAARLGQVNRYFALGLMAITALAVVGERPLGEVAMPEYDKVSVVHLTMAALAALSWTLLGALTTHGPKLAARALRLFLMAAVGVPAVGLLATVYPGLLLNPMAPQLAFAGLRRIINELDPLYPNTPERLNTFLIAIGLVFVVAVALPWQVIAGGGARRRLLWGVAAAATAVFLGLSLWQMRFAPYLGVFLVVPVAALVGASREGLLDRIGAPAARLAQFTLLGLVMVLPFALQQLHFHAFLGGDPRAIRRTATCDLLDMVPFLNAANEVVAGSKIIMTSLGYTTALLYHTRHAVVGSAYHRNVRGTQDTFDLMNSVDDGAALALVRRRGIDLFLFCRVSEDPSFESFVDGRPTLYRRLLDGRPPSWLNPLALPGDLGERFRLHGVVEGAS